MEFEMTFMFCNYGRVFTITILPVLMCMIKRIIMCDMKGSQIIMVLSLRYYETFHI